MSNMNVRLVTSTALVTALVGFLNLPAKANPEFMEGQTSVRASASVVNEDVQILPEVKTADVSDKEMDALINEIQKKSGQQAPEYKIKKALTEDEKKRQLTEVGAGPIPPELIQAEKDRALNLEIEPLIGPEKGVVSDRFITNSKIALLAEHYAYLVTKGNNQLQDKEALKPLEAMGCERTGVFSALEGKYLNFNTTAGSIFYNSEQNRYFIVWHGTSSNEEGWQTNLDIELIEASQIKTQIMETIRDEVISTLRDEKGGWLYGLFSGPEDAQLAEIMNFVGEKLTTDLSFDELKVVRDILKLKIKKLSPRVANKRTTKKEVPLLEKIDAIFAVKMEMLGKQDYVVQDLKADAVSALKEVMEEIDEGLGLTVKDDKQKINSPSAIVNSILVHKIQSLKDETVREQLKNIISNLRKLAGDIETHLPKCKTEADIRRFMSHHKDNLNALKGRNSVIDHIAKRLISSMDKAVSSRQKRLSQLGKFRELEFTGQVHRGYALKVASAGTQVEDIIQQHVRTLSDELRQRVSFEIIGHSMGGALAKIHAATFIPRCAEITGHMPTAANNRLSIHAISAAPTGNHTFGQDLESKLGLNNIADQKVEEDFVPKADVFAYVPDRFKYLVAKLPWAGKEFASRLESKYALQIGTLLLDTLADVKERAKKHFPKERLSSWNPLKRLWIDIALAHYGIYLGDKQPEGENYGRDEHFEVALADPDTKEAWNKMLAYGAKKRKKKF